MSLLPPGWTTVTLGELIAPRSTRVHPSTLPTTPYIGLEHVEAHSNRITSTVAAGSMASAAAAFQAGDVLYGRMRPYLNKVVAPGFDGLASPEFIVMPPSAAIDTTFLLRRLSANDFVEFACRRYEGDRPRVKFDQLASFEWHPAAEQIRIVEKLEELLPDLDAGVAELQAAQKKLQQYRQSLLKAAVEGSLTTAWREAHPPPTESGAELLARILRERQARWEAQQLAKFEARNKAPTKGWREAYVEPAPPSTEGMPPLPPRWAWASAEQLCTFITKGTTPPKGHDTGGKRVIPFLRVTNLTDRGVLDLTDRVLVSTATHEGFLARSKVFPGDVLMNIVGPPLGQVALVPDTSPEWNINQAIAIFRAVAGVLPDFVCSYLLSPVAQQWLKTRAKTTAGQTNLTLEVCRQLPIPLPPIAEQEAVVSALTDQLEALGGLADAVHAVDRQSSAQRQNLLRAAFAGQLVPQDPNDEPASALLARIRAERATQDAAKKQQPRGRARKEPA